MYKSLQTSVLQGLRYLALLSKNLLGRLLPKQPVKQYSWPLATISKLLATACIGVVLGTSSASAQTTITGTVFFDGNNDGAYTASKEVGFGGVVIKAYDASNVAVASATSNLSSGTIGAYSLSGLTSGTTYRVEFVLPSGYNDGAQKSTSASSVQFIKAGATANFGVYTTGVCDPGGAVQVVAGCASIDGSPTSVASWGYFSDRQTTIANNSTNFHHDDLDNSQVGIPMGIGSRMKDKLVFFSTVTAPLTTIFPTAPGGPSAIYVADYSASGNLYNNQYKLLTKLSSLSPSVDVSAQFKVGSDENTGEVGLGGLDMTDDGKFLYVVNMGNGKIVKLDISSVTLGSIPGGGYTGASLAVSELTIPSTLASCTGGRFRPSALEIYAGSMYVGGVCDASTGTSSNLTLKVLKMDLTTGTWTEILNYGLSAIKGGSLRYSGWPNVKWSDNFVGLDDTDGEVQPIVNDLAIDDYGSVIIGIANRKVFSSKSNRDMGYMLRTYRKADGTMEMENAGQVGPLTSQARTDEATASPGLNAGSNSQSELEMISFGPGKNWFLEIGRTRSHPYLYNGGVFVLPGTKEVLAGFTDPLDGFGYAGGRYMNYDNGVANYGISLTDNKVFALTGLETVCAESNIEIGNLVWNDVDNNGRQDPGEAGIAGINVTLKSSSGSTIATAKTDGNGNYIFSNASGTSNGSFLYNLALSPTTSYSVTIDDFSTQTSGLSPTLANIASNGEDQRDNDGTPVGANSVIAFTTGAAGANDHTLDFGFTFSCPSPNCYPTTVTKN